MEATIVLGVSKVSEKGGVFPGSHVWCRQVGNNHHPAHVFFRDAHPHFEIVSCGDCAHYDDCGQVEGKLNGS